MPQAIDSQEKLIGLAKIKYLPPIRKKNSELRRREFLTPDEADRVISAAGQAGRHPIRDETMLLLMYRHGLRVGEAVSLHWSDIDLNARELYVARLKNGKNSTHPLGDVEIRALRQLRNEYDNVPYVFVSERRGPLATRTARDIVARAGRAAGLTMPIHCHMLRHGCGYYLANRGIDTRAIQDYLGHKSIQHSVRYTELAPGRFKDFWKD